MDGNCSPAKRSGVAGIVDHMGPSTCGIGAMNKTSVSCKTTLMMVPPTPVALSRQQSHQSFPALAVNMKVLKRLYAIDSGGLLQEELLHSIHLLCSQLADYHRQQQEEGLQRLREQQASNGNSPAVGMGSGRRYIQRDVTKYY